MIVYVFLIQRPNVDKQPWPVVYDDRALAEKAYGRVSPVVPVEVSKHEEIGVQEESQAGSEAS